MLTMMRPLAAIVLAVLIALPLRAQETAPAKGLAAQLQPFVDSNSLAGAVLLVADKDKILTLETVGYSDVGTHEAMRPDALFWIASMSKPMTAAGLMILVDENKVSLDDAVEKYLPEFKGQMIAEKEPDSDKVVLKKPSHPITVREVLAHTSGLPFLSKVESKIDVVSMRDAAIGYGYTELQFDPGTKYTYSNTGINTAGRIIEVVSGMPFATFMEKRLLKPLGMKDTTFWPDSGQLKRLAKTYKPNAEKTGLEETKIQYMTEPYDNKDRAPCPGGGYFSTARDVGAFGQMLLNNGLHKGKRVLSENAVAQLTMKQTGKLDNNYGLGFAIDKTPGAGYGHGGAYSTDLWVMPQKGLVLVYLVQHAGYPNNAAGKVLAAFRTAAQQAFAP